MASVSHFKEYPAFPNNIRSASMTKISLKKLRENNKSTCQDMFQACRTLGFFLLDLSGDQQGEEFVSVIDAVLRLTKDVMALDQEEKMRYHATPPERLVG
jgi:isopenicillin N synthase-like dioxygenase